MGTSLPTCGFAQNVIDGGENGSSARTFQSRAGFPYRDGRKERKIMQ